MKYYKLKIALKDYEDRLNRTILFKYDKDLDELAFSILSIFNTLAYHMYKFEDDINTYECNISLEQAREMGYPNDSIDTWMVTLDNLSMRNNKFMMIYDFGEEYEFVIEILEEVEMKKIYQIPRVIDGVGYGIVEDAKFVLEDYLDGKPLEYPLLFIKRGRFTMIDFNSFDIEECNKKIVREIAKIRNSYYVYI
ncbi:MAG: hypothetical protein IJX78_02060 [Bacilli bacterium]|nr:hypothetical protein [Bacilli bacterium]